MTFYLQPPSGNVSYQMLEDFGLNRFRFLSRLVACKDEEERREAILDAETVNGSDCLILGSVKDKISHHILRLTLAGNLESAHFLCKAETIFFRMRLDSFSTQEWLSFFKTLKKKLTQHRNDDLNDIHVFLSSFCDKPTTWLSFIEGMKSSEDESKGVCLPFQLVPTLVSKRLVVLTEGYASVPLYLIPSVLEGLFSSLMVKMMQQSCQSHKMHQNDARMSRLKAVMERAYQREVNSVSVIPYGSKALTLDDFGSSQICFPPCMLHLMRGLEKYHRLCHQDRIQLTLFLKEIGLPVHQALLFWKREYSKPSVIRSNGVSCGHNWQGNERKYIYNIRHLYGLEGKRVSYTAHSCQSIQGRQLSCVDNGGCPFTTLESSALTTQLSDEGLAMSDIEDILHCVKDGCVQRACRIATGHRVIRGVETKNNSELHLSNASKDNTQNASCSSCCQNRQLKRMRLWEFNTEDKSKYQKCDDIYYRECRRQPLRLAESHGPDVDLGKHEESFQNDFSCHSETNSTFLRSKSKDKSHKSSEKRHCDESSIEQRRGKNKLLHCCEESGSKTSNSVYNRDKMKCSGTVNSINTIKKETNHQICICRTEIIGNHNLTIGDRDLFHPHDKGRCHSCDSETESTDFKCQSYEKFISRFQAEKCHNFKDEKIPFSGENQKSGDSRDKEIDNDLILNESERKSCCCDESSVIKKQDRVLFNDTKDLFCEGCFRNNSSIISGENKASTAEFERRRKPSSIYWDVKSLADG